jgi:hypothetical protein
MSEKVICIKNKFRNRKAIEKWASDEFPNVNGQIEWMLNNSLKEAIRLKVKPLQKSKARMV